MIATLARLYLSAIPGMPTFKPKHTPDVTATPLPANASADEVVSAMFGAGMYRGVIILLGIGAVVVLVVYAYSKLEG